MREIVFDTETTGFYPEKGDRLVEIGAVELIDHVQTGVTFHEYINPEREVPEDVVKIHGLTYEFLKDYPTFAAYKDEFLRFIEGKEIIGHNVQFDMNFINNEVGFELPNKVTDTLEMARKVFPEQRNNLCALSERLNIKIKHSPYNGALLDALYAYEVYKRLKNEQKKI